MPLSAAQMAQVEAAYYAAAVRRSQKLPAQTVSAGGSYDIAMPNAGVATDIQLTFDGTFSRTETATVGTVTATTKGAFAVISNVGFKDYLGIDRAVGIDGYDLFVHEITTENIDPTYGTAALMADPDSIGYAFTVPTGTASSTTTSTCIFTVTLPISVLRSSVRGSYPFTVPRSQNVLHFEIQPTLTSSNATTAAFPVTITGASSVSFSGSVYIEYFYYDVPASVALPTWLFSEVHELVKVKDQSNLSAGSDKQFQLPTGRTYLRIYERLVNGTSLTYGANGSLTITEMKFLIDSATPTIDMLTRDYIRRYLKEHKASPQPGDFVYDFSSHPWSPDSYGSLSTSLIINSAATINSGATLEVLRQCLYTQAQNPNLVQAGVS